VAAEVVAWAGTCTEIEQQEGGGEGGRGGGPLMAADMARAMPVLPLVASIRVSPGCMRPAFSASLIMLMAGLHTPCMGESDKCLPFMCGCMTGGTTCSHGFSAGFWWLASALLEFF